MSDDIQFAIPAIVRLLVAAMDERDRARSIAARLEAENARLEHTILALRTFAKGEA